MRRLWLALMIIFPILLVVGIVLGGVGSGIFVTESRDVEVTRQTTCNGYNYDIFTDTCSEQECTTGSTSSSSRCTTRYYTCYFYVVELWYIAVQSGGTNVTTNYESNRYDFRSSAESYAEEHMGPRMCFYDTTDLRRVRWTEPNPIPFLGLLLFGWILCGVIIIAAVAIWVVKAVLIGDGPNPCSWD